MPFQGELTTIDSSLRRSERNIETKIKRPTDLFKNKRVKTQVVMPSEGISGLLLIKDNSVALLQ